MNWQAFHQAEQSKPYYKNLMNLLREDELVSRVFPPEPIRFRAFSLTSFDEVRVVILGQDPYHGFGQADGLAFSSQTAPPSLKNIYKELYQDLGISPNATGDLTHWATQGVLLLNTTLTVREKEPMSHSEYGWEIYTDHVIETLSKEKEHIVFLLWGKHAYSKKKLIDSRHTVLTAPHPSPLSAYRGFYGCKHFSKTNYFLAQHKQKPILW